ncbi:DUF4123 domain-containing protein [Chitinimonas sp. JJ19]|uniref:DUF4123 domain-containing protein n=1 Tax=Chitinimonas sp. JJ19 TaxID=3109352 RepID=UPI002FFF1662
MLAEPTLPTPRQAADKLLPLLARCSGRPYAVVDASHGEQAYELITRWGEHAHCLYSGQEATTLARYAPYLLELRENSAALMELLEQAWQLNWAIFVDGAADWQKVRLQLKKSLFVLDENKDRHYFRYYDARILRLFLPTASKEQAAQFFGEDIYAFYAKTVNPQQWVEYRRSSPKALNWLTGEISLTATAWAP